MRIRVVLTALVLAATLAGASAADAADEMLWGTPAALRFGPLGGGTGSTLFADSGYPTGEAVDLATGKVYWADQNSGTIRVGNLDGSGTPQDLYQAQTPIGNLGIDTADGTLYWANYAAGTIDVGNLDGSGTPQALFSGEGGPISVAIDPAAGKMYWADYSAGTLREGSLDGTGTAQTILSGIPAPYGVALDPTAAGTLYWAEQESGRIRSDDAQGFGDVPTLFSGESGPSGVAVDPSSPPGTVYWADIGSGTIRSGGTNGTGAQTLFSGETSPVSPVLIRAPLGTGAPGVSGGTTQGSTITCSDGSWAQDLPGAFLYREPRSYAFSWKRDGTATSDTTATITASAPGSYTCTVTAKNAVGSASQTSPAYEVTPTGDTLSVGRVKVSGSTARVPLQCRGSAAAGCDVTLTLKTTDPAGSLHVVIVGRASASLSPGQSKTVPIALNATGQRLLAKRGRLQTTLIVTQSGEVAARKVVTFHQT